ncbi:MAG: hypothetical protein ACLFR0_02820 [Alphaproteobacteria bacterium]
MNKKPLGADLDFYDGEWIFPTALLVLAMLFGDIIWIKQIHIVVYAIACLHTVHEYKNAFGRKGMGMRYLYALLGFLSAILHFILPLIYILISYGLCSSQLKKNGEERFLIKKRKTFVTMISLLVFAAGVHAWNAFLLVDDLQAIQAEREMTDRPGTISQ